MHVARLRPPFAAGGDSQARSVGIEVHLAQAHVARAAGRADALGIDLAPAAGTRSQGTRARRVAQVLALPQVGQRLPLDPAGHIGAVALHKDAIGVVIDHGHGHVARLAHQHVLARRPPGDHLCRVPRAAQAVGVLALYRVGVGLGKPAVLQALLVVDQPLQRPLDLGTAIDEPRIDGLAGACDGGRARRKGRRGPGKGRRAPPHLVQLSREGVDLAVEGLDVLVEKGQQPLLKAGNGVVD